MCNFRRFKRKSKLYWMKTERKFSYFGGKIFELKNGRWVPSTEEEFIDYINQKANVISNWAFTVYLLLIGIWGTVFAALVWALISE